jgi:hypothetical protein
MPRKTNAPLRVAKDIDPTKVRTVKVSKKPALLYRKTKKYRLINQISPDQIPEKTKNEPIIKHSKSSKPSKSSKLSKHSKKSSESSESPKNKEMEQETHDTQNDVQNVDDIPKYQQFTKIFADDMNLRDSIEYIIREVDHLEYQHRKEILTMIIDQGHQELISESSDGSRIDMSKLPIDMINQIKNFVSVKLKTIDITDKFEQLYSDISNAPNPKEKNKIKKKT